MSIKDFAEKYIRAYDETFLTGNCVMLEALEDPGMVHHSVRRGRDGVVGREAHKRGVLDMRQALPGVRPDLEYLTGEGSLFAVSYKAHGTFTSRAQGWPEPTGKEVVLNYLYLFRVDKGRITEAWYHGTAEGLG